MNDSGLSRVLDALGIETGALLGSGGEAAVYALDAHRVARICHPGTVERTIAERTALLQELAGSAHCIPFAVPTVLEILTIGDRIVTIERRLPGRPLAEVLGEAAGAARPALVCAYLDTAARIGDLTVNRPWYGDLAGDSAIRTRTFRAYLEQRAARSLASAGSGFERIDAKELAAALPEPATAALVHLDAFPGNMLAEGETVTAVLDFGVVAIVGDRRLEPLTAAVYLTPLITPMATDADRAVAHEWLVAQGLAELYEPAQRWIAAFWSFARDDRALFQWCQSILLA